ncbi:MAG: DUF134 domain-containing protein [Candidatus Thermoplasmatota archaeon]
MPRPQRCRKVCFQPNITYFKPAGIPLPDLQSVILTIDELEAIRLKDYEELDQEAAAQLMHISQPTFHRLLGTARKKIAAALINGTAIRIEGGNIEFISPPYNHPRRRCRKRGAPL